LSGAAAMARTAPASVPPGVVPREFVGLARQLWQRVDAEARIVNPEQRRLIAMLEALEPRRGFRQRKVVPTLRSVTAHWRHLPSFARLAFKVTSSAEGFKLVEVRATPTRMHMQGWETDELAIGIRLVEIEFKRRVLDIKRRPLGDACLHALARRYQRGDNCSDNAVLADLLELACAFPERALAGGDFRVPAGGGAWVGERVRYDGGPHLAARTYVAG
jgi:hypothetical protein